MEADAFGPAPAPAKMRSYVATCFGDLQDCDGNWSVSPCKDDLKVSSDSFDKHVDDRVRLSAGE